MLQEQVDSGLAVHGALIGRLRGGLPSTILQSPHLEGLEFRVQLTHPRGWRLDGGSLGLTEDRLVALPFAKAFAAMESLESGHVANADEGRQVGHFWLRAPELAPTVGQARTIGEAVEAVETLAEGVRSGSLPAPDGQPFTDVLHIGIGGSALGPRLLTAALGDGQLPIHFADNVDPDGLAVTLDRIGDRLRHTLIVVASKSGGTVEPMATLRLVRARLMDMGLDSPGRLVALTSPGSKLHKTADKERWLGILPVWSWVGGRFSVTSAVGLLPMALGGADVRAFLQGAREMDAWTRDTIPTDNPAAVLAGAWYLLGEGRGARDLVILPYRDRLSLLGNYLQQLVMESVGKATDRRGELVQHGLVVYGNRGTTDQHAFVQQLRDGRDDAITHFVQVLAQPGCDQELGDLLQDFLLGTRRALIEADRPSLTLTLPGVDAISMGGLLALFERAVGLYAELVDLNAYHQPGVEAGKLAARGAAALRTRLLANLTDRARRLEDLAEVCEAPVDDARDLLDRLVATGRAVRELRGYRAHRPLDG